MRRSIRLSSLGRNRVTLLEYDDAEVIERLGSAAEALQCGEQSGPDVSRLANWERSSEVEQSFVAKLFGRFVHRLRHAIGIHKDKVARAETHRGLRVFRTRNQSEGQALDGFLGMRCFLVQPLPTLFCSAIPE